MSFTCHCWSKTSPKKKRVDKQVTEVEAGNSKQYNVEAIKDNAVYVNKAERYLPDLYYLVAWKRYFKEENTWKRLFAIQHLKKLINFFFRKYLKKLTATSPPIDFALPMARPTVKPTKPIS